jgi:hypothetical protein
MELGTLLGCWFFQLAPSIWNRQLIHQKPGVPVFSRSSIVNRCGIGVVPQKPFFRWVQEGLGHETTAIGAFEPLLLLIPCYKDQDEAMVILEDEFATIFRMELMFWCTDVKLWPWPLTFYKFLEWFGIRFYGLIGDMGVHPLESHEFNESFVKAVFLSAEDQKR